MFGWFEKKSEVEKLIDRVGMEEAVRHCAGVVSKKIPTLGIFRQFILEELDAAQHGNAEAKAFVRSTGIPSSEYDGAMSRSRPEVDGSDGPQQTLVRICMQLGDDAERVARFRIAVVQSLMNNATMEPPARKAPDIRSEADVVQLISEQGAEAAGDTLRKLANVGNLTCQIALSQIGLAMLDSQKSGQNVPGHEQQKGRAWKECENYTRLAAEQGDAGSQFNLAKLYFDAIDVSGGVLRALDRELMEKAIRWHRKAAAQGFKDSVEELKWLEDTFPDVVRSA